MNNDQLGFYAAVGGDEEVTSASTFEVTGDLTVGDDIFLSSGSVLIWANDTNLYRAAANVLATEDVFRTGVFTTANRPAAAIVGQGGQVFDSTLNKPIWSTGAAWVEAAPSGGFVSSAKWSTD